MKFAPLFRTRVRHDYYPNKVCGDLVFEPTAETRRLIERYRLRVQELLDGIAVWAEKRPDVEPLDAKPLIEMSGVETFVFHLLVRNPNFNLFTDLKALEAKTDPVYSHPRPSDGMLELHDRKTRMRESFFVLAHAIESKFALSGNPIASDGDAKKEPQPSDFRIEPPGVTGTIMAYEPKTKKLTIQTPAEDEQTEVTVSYRTKPSRDRTVLADVELSYDPSVPALGESDPPFKINFQIQFRAKAGRWAYYLITDQKGEFSVVDSSEALSFAKFLLSEIPKEADVLASEFSQLYSQSKLEKLRFVSNEPVPCSSTARKGIELKLGGKKVLGKLPNPALRHLSRIGDEDAFYQVIKYLVNPRSSTRGV